MRIHVVSAGSLISLAVLHGNLAGSGEARFLRVHELKPDEGVYAYARISPSGQFLAYSSEIHDRHTQATTQTVTIVDLRTRRIVFVEAGIDPYWSNDGRRLIFLSRKDGRESLSIRDNRRGAIVRDVAPADLGDYWSWGVRDGKDIVLTIKGHFFFIEGDKGVLPWQSVGSCPGIGVGARPLLSKDGRRVSVFVRNRLVVRNLVDCHDVFETGVQGAKADFSWDGRYLAFHAPKEDLTGYEIRVMDLQRRTIRTVTKLRGSSLFPSWTRDGRLCFRYDGDDYRGFVMAVGVLEVPERPFLEDVTDPLPNRALRWHDLFASVLLPKHRVSLVTIWATWSAHSPAALIALKRAAEYVEARGLDADIVTALELSSRRPDVERTLERLRVTLPEIRIRPERLGYTAAINQIPSTLLFRDGVLIDSRLGTQSYEELLTWLAEALKR